MRACPLCSGHAGHAVWAGDASVAVRCAQCDFAYLAQIRADVVAQDRRMYEELYARPGRLSDLTAERYTHTLAGFERRRIAGRLLDIGCGAGWFVAAAAYAGWEAIGTEVAATSGRISLPGSARIVIGESATRELDSGAFDVVTLWEVVEHVDDPVGLLREVHRLLRPGGLLYLTTPNHDSLQRRLLRDRWIRYHTEHLGYFDARSAVRAIELAGLRVLSLGTKNFDPYAFLAGLAGRRGAADGRPSVESEIAPRRERLRWFARRTKVGRFFLAAANALLARMNLGDTLVIQAER